MCRIYEALRCLPEGATSLCRRLLQISLPRSPEATVMNDVEGAAAKNDRTEMEKLPRVENCNSAGLTAVANAGVLLSSIVFVRRLVLSSSVVTRTLYPSFVSILHHCSLNFLVYQFIMKSFTAIAALVAVVPALVSADLLVNTPYVPPRSANFFDSFTSNCLLIPSLRTSVVQCGKT